MGLVMLGLVVLLAILSLRTVVVVVMELVVVLLVLVVEVVADGCSGGACEFAGGAGLSGDGSVARCL
jgi:hypothetical protein